MLNPPTLVEHNIDSIVNGTSLRCSPPRSSNRWFDKKWSRFSKRRFGCQVANQMASKNHALNTYGLYVTSCDYTCL
jgi:hypothetical protein